MGNSAYSRPREVQSVLFPEYLQRLPSQNGKAFAVTGCTTGTGFVFARTAAQKGAHVVLLNRPSERAISAEREIRLAAPDASAEGRITCVDCDLMSFASVKAAAEKLNELFAEKGLDCLVNNAGVMAVADQATEDGYDVQMQTNHLSHFLLTQLLFPLLTKAADQRGEARVVNHTSLARFGAKLRAEYLGKNGGSLGGNGSSMFCQGARWVRYHHSKLANAVFTLALHDRLAPINSKVKAVCAAPGLAATNLQVTTAIDGGFHASWIMKFAQSPEDGTLPLLICAMGLEATAKAQAVTVTSGELWEPRSMGGGTGHPERRKLTKEVTDAKSREMLWEESEKACGQFKLG